VNLLNFIVLEHIKGDVERKLIDLKQPPTNHKLNTPQNKQQQDPKG
jgi:hypothetical protein